MFRKLILLLTLAGLLLGACVPAATPTSTPTAIPPTATSAPTVLATAVPTATATAIPAPTTNLTDGCLAAGAYDPNVDYFPEKASLTHTAGFTLEYHKHYKVITVLTPWPGATEGLQYALVQCGAPAPEGFDEDQIIEVPVKTIVTMSTTYLPYLDQLALLDRLVGLDDATYVSNKTVLKMVADGKIKTIGSGATVNVEQALDLRPDLVMTYGSGSSEYDAHPKLIEAGLKVAINAEWLDTSPLGRAEWGKFIAAFFNREADAEKQFADLVARYEELKALAAKTDEKPTVFANTAYQGTWYMPGGHSYAARFLTDAGAAYLWADDTSIGSLPLAFEAVYDKAKDADFWVNVGFVSSLADLKAADARYADFAAFKSGNVWNNDARTTPSGGNDYYESAVASPDVVLADLIKIFHPELLPDHQLVYYRQLK